MTKYVMHTYVGKVFFSSGASFTVCCENFILVTNVCDPLCFYSTLMLVATTTVCDFLIISYFYKI